jgi:hypothetical protein
MCIQEFGAGAVGSASEFQYLVSLVDIHPAWDPAPWLFERRDLVEDVLRLTTGVQAPVAAVVAATAMLEHDRYQLVRVWQAAFLLRDMEVIAAAACQRLPELS